MSTEHDRMIAQATAKYDQWRALLSDSIRALSKETMATWLCDLEDAMTRRLTTSVERLEANAMLVGILTVMLDDVREADERRAAK